MPPSQGFYASGSVTLDTRIKQATMALSHEGGWSPFSGNYLEEFFKTPAFSVFVGMNLQLSENDVCNKALLSYPCELPGNAYMVVSAHVAWPEHITIIPGALTITAGFERRDEGNVRVGAVAHTLTPTAAVYPDLPLCVSPTLRQMQRVAQS